MVMKKPDCAGFFFQSRRSGRFLLIVRVLVGDVFLVLKSLLQPLLSLFHTPVLGVVYLLAGRWWRGLDVVETGWLVLFV